MLSRLIVLSILREVAEYLERAGVPSAVVREWCAEGASIIVAPCPTMEHGRVIEQKLAAHVRLAFEAAEDLE